jgi:hypothetical protein
LQREILSSCRLLGAAKTRLMRTWREILKLQHPQQTRRHSNLSCNTKFQVGKPLKTPNLTAGLIMIFFGTISLILSVSPSLSYNYDCTLTQDLCDGIWRGHVLQNFIEYFLLGSVLMALSAIVLFLGRTKTEKTHPTAGIKGYRPWFDNDS